MITKYSLKDLRYKSKKKFSKAGQMSFSDEDSAEQSTPEVVANYRAKRIFCETVADLCCGIGTDAIALAKNCKKVYAVDKIPDVLEAAKKNAQAYGAKNIEFIQTDA
ncbi:MAG: methyltransferase domain-containing protein, partial [Candidatus Diapherotrites archaeon]|nr:methyltransferase domain-containing protein [Candidatus Diapherotrites archaeon]